MARVRLSPPPLQSLHDLYKYTNDDDEFGGGDSSISIASSSSSSFFSQTFLDQNFRKDEIIHKPHLANQT